MSRSRLLLAVISALVLSGCASEKQDVKPKAAEVRPEATWTLQYDAGKPLPMAANVSGVFLAGDTAIFPFSDRRFGRNDRLGSLDLSTGKRTALARTGFPGGTIVAAVQVGNEVVYLDESARGNRDPGAAMWRVIALKSHRVLASSGNHRVSMSPDLTVVYGDAVWTVFSEQSGDMSAFGWKPGSKIKRRDALPGDEHECTPPASNPELVYGCDVRGDWIAWAVKADRDEAIDDEHPAPVYYASAGGGDPHLLGEMLIDSGPPVIFGDYLLWDSGERVTIASLEHPSATAEVTIDRRASTIFYGAEDAQRVAVVSHQDDMALLTVIDADQLRLTSSVTP